jgi:hypothetical protein
MKLIIKTACEASIPAAALQSKVHSGAAIHLVYFVKQHSYARMGI